MLIKARKKPIEIEAMQFTGENKNRVYNWISGTRHYADFDENKNPILIIETLEGNHAARIGDWIIKGVAGEFYPCKPNIFAKTYEIIEEKSDLGFI